MSTGTIPTTGRAFLSLSPNPFRDRVKIDFILPAETKVRASIYDVTGRFVKKLYDGKSEGKLTLNWRGDIKSGGYASTGIYFLRVENLTSKSATTRKLIMIEMPIYYIKILGNLNVYKNQNYLSVELRPKDIAFLIQLALRADEPGSKILLKSLYNNFWKNGTNQSRNLSHLLVRIKKALNIPTHLLGVFYKNDNPFLFNKGIHFITDYGEYKEHIAKAKALLRAGEWEDAKQEFLQAFELFRGEPFKKMYDDWSDDKRLEVLFNFETEVLAFLKELTERGGRKEANKLLKKEKRIVPYPDKIEKLLKELD